MKKLKILFQNNEKWAAEKTKQDPNYFKRLAKDQDPHFLWIGCSDSRVPANEIVGLEPGELFVHRNVANICPHTDFNCLSVLEFAVNMVHVEHVIICGHYGCSGVKAAMEDHHLGLVDNWLRNIRDVHARHKEELDAIQDPHLRHNRLVELNVLQQVLNVCHTTIVQEAWANHRSLYIHGWVYDLESGRLKDLNSCFSSLDQVEEVYRIQMKRQH
ncbi:MAG: carbonate dehydratase [Verrucomicrobiota bacterium]|nr:carbonate dehydratase [Verrucomicrobiota bacterium]